ncbi:hypothetical protein Tco_1214103 [Tanacetum coccineum]
MGHASSRPSVGQLKNVLHYHKRTSHSLLSTTMNNDLKYDSLGVFFTTSLEYIIMIDYNVPGGMTCPKLRAKFKVGDQDVGDDSVRDVSLNLKESVADRIRRIKGVNPYNEAMKQPRQAFRVIRNPCSDYGLSNDEGDGIGVSAHAGKFGSTSSFEGFTSSFGDLNPKSSTMNPSSGPEIKVAAWSNATPAGVSNDSTTTPTGGANMEAKSRVQPASANEQ